MSEMELTLKDVDRILTKAKPRLLGPLDLSDVGLVADLEADGVITSALKNKIEVDVLTKHEKVSQLLDSLKTGPVKRFLLFCRILNTETHSHLLEIMGVDINQIEAQLGNTGGTYYTTGTSTARGPVVELTADELNRFMAVKSIDMLDHIRPSMDHTLLMELVAGGAISPRDKITIEEAGPPGAMADKLFALLKSSRKFSNFRKVLTKRGDDYLEDLLADFFPEKHL